MELQPSQSTQPSVRKQAWLRVISEQDGCQKPAFIPLTKMSGFSLETWKLKSESLGAPCVTFELC